MTVSWTKKSKNKHVRRALPSLVSAIKGLGKPVGNCIFSVEMGGGKGGGGGEGRVNSPLVAQDKLRSGVMG